MSSIRSWLRLGSRAMLGLVIASFAQAVLSQQDAAKKHAERLTGDAAGKAANNPQCKMFSPAEIASYLGVTVEPGQNAAGGSSCSWSDKAYEATALVQIVPARFHSPPSLVKGFKLLPGVGTKGWVAPDAGWTAGTIVDDVAIIVGLDGKKADEAAVVALLKETIKRRAK